MAERTRAFMSTLMLRSRIRMTMVHSLEGRENSKARPFYHIPSSIVHTVPSGALSHPACIREVRSVPRWSRQHDLSPIYDITTSQEPGHVFRKSQSPKGPRFSFPAHEKHFQPNYRISAETRGPQRPSHKDTKTQGAKGFSNLRF